MLRKPFLSLIAVFGLAATPAALALDNKPTPSRDVCICTCAIGDSQMGESISIGGRICRPTESGEGCTNSNGQSGTKRNCKTSTEPVSQTLLPGSELELPDEMIEATE